MAQNLNQKWVMQALDWAYYKAQSGDTGFDSAYKMAEEYAQWDNKEDAINRLINWQTAKSGAVGFVTGLGGLPALPVTLPANITGILLMQLRMIAAIAIIRGYDVKSDQVKSFAFCCLLGSGVTDALKVTGISIGKAMTKSAIQGISGATLLKINKLVGVRLLTKFGSKGALNLGKAIPIAGGIIGGAVDATSTKVIGNAAKKIFVEKSAAFEVG